MELIVGVGGGYVHVRSLLLWLGSCIVALVCGFEVRGVFGARLSLDIREGSLQSSEVVVAGC